MNKLIHIGVLFLLPLHALSDNWTAAQQEVIASIKACWTATEKDFWLDCYHDDFVGWYKDRTAPITMADKRADADSWDWDATDYKTELVEFSPHMVNIKGDVAVVIYSATSKSTHQATNESTVSKERWMEVDVKLNGRWVSIAEHATTVASD